MVDSSREGMRKPDPAIYHLTQERLGVDDPASILFLDDAEGNIVAARELGWHTVQVEDEYTAGDQPGRRPSSSSDQPDIGGRQPHRWARIDPRSCCVRQAEVRRDSAQVRPCSTLTSRGRPSTISATMLRCTANVPPPSVSAGENRNP